MYVLSTTGNAQLMENYRKGQIVSKHRRQFTSSDTDLYCHLGLQELLFSESSLEVVLVYCVV